MFKTVWTLLFCTLLAGPAFSAEVPEYPDGMKAFPSLKALHVRDVDVTLYYAVSVSEVLTAPHPEAKEIEEAGVIIARPLRTKLLGPGKGFFTVDCDSGPSDDPSCSIFQETNGHLKQLVTISGLRFAFPANGCIYVDGHTNTMFNQRRKFEWRGDNFVEVKQPFLYVGLETTTNDAVSIYSATDLKQVVAELPKDSPVEILINDGDLYLLKTPFGLVGWLNIAEGEMEAPIAGVFYAGD